MMVDTVGMMVAIAMTLGVHGSTYGHENMEVVA